MGRPLSRLSTIHNGDHLLAASPGHSNHRWQSVSCCARVLNLNIQGIALYHNPFGNHLNGVEHFTRTNGLGFSGQLSWHSAQPCPSKTDCPLPNADNPWAPGQSAEQQRSHRNSRASGFSDSKGQRKAHAGKVPWVRRLRTCTVIITGPSRRFSTCPWRTTAGGPFLWRRSMRCNGIWGELKGPFTAGMRGRFKAERHLCPIWRKTTGVPESHNSGFNREC